MTTAVVENNTLNKLQSFFNDAVYQELTQNSARFNVNIRKDRIYRQPYIDGQTGIAQRHCNLFVSGKERMPGILQGQVYTYPAKRWKSNHRSYLASFMQASKPETEEHTITTVENPAALIPPIMPEELPPVMPMEKQIKIHNVHQLSQEPWAYYEETVFEEEMEEEFESEEDFEDETYTRKGNKKKKLQGRKSKQLKQPKKRPVLKAPARLLRSIKKDENDTENKPYVCELCGMRYKTRPGLTYHYAHSHREDDDDPNNPKPNTTPSKYPTMPLDPSAPADGSSFPTMPHQAALQSMVNNWTPENGVTNGRPSVQPPTTTAAPTETSSTTSTASPTPVPDAAPPAESATPAAPPSDKEETPKNVAPSPYCDFCLGDSIQNKKTGQAEKLVSCADCGRSGHPTCLQFTENMIKSVLKYRWQCIECKTCTLCGTSENDDQLLFCDDCDRGYHLYCLSPPLQEPPEGEWSCDLCIKEFHKK